MLVSNWLSNNYIEVFGAVSGVIYVFLEIRQSIWLWPIGIITSAVYIWVFFTGKLYADMSLQGYYLVISILGWYWWVWGVGQRAKGTGHGAQGKGQRDDGEKRRREEREKGRKGEKETGSLVVTRLKVRVGVILAAVFIVLYICMWVILSNLTDSPVPQWDSFITSLSVVATWMLARKIYEHWYLWIVVNIVAMMLFFSRELYPTVVLYLVYGIMSFVGLKEWKKTIAPSPDPH